MFQKLHDKDIYNTRSRKTIKWISDHVQWNTSLSAFSAQEFRIDYVLDSETFSSDFHT